MGLDWQPLGKPEPGHEAEFDEIYEEIFEVENRDRSLWKRLREIAVSPYETLGAPRVGFDAEADRWAAEEYSKRPWKKLFVSRRKWRKILHGYYVLDLVSPNDGMPAYSNGGRGSYCEVYAFRAKFLEFCSDMLGDELFGEAWAHHRAAELTDYGARLRAHAAAFAEGQACPMSPDNNTCRSRSRIGNSRRRKRISSIRPRAGACSGASAATACTRISSDRRRRYGSSRPLRLL